MKKMSDVFELPLAVEFVGAGEFHIKNHSRHVPAICSYSSDQAFAVAHAINHVDALADVLESLLNDKAMIHFNNKKHMQAVSALVDYRGEE